MRHFVVWMVVRELAHGSIRSRPGIARRWVNRLVSGGPAGTEAMNASSACMAAIVAGP
jgi:hypothetical protein